MAYKTIRLVNLPLTGMLAGNELGTWAAVHPALEGLGPAKRLRAEQALTRSSGRSCRGRVLRGDAREHQARERPDKRPHPGAHGGHPRGVRAAAGPVGPAAHAARCPDHGGPRGPVLRRARGGRAMTARGASARTASAVSLGAAAFGAATVGTVAIGALAIRRLVIRRGRVGRLSIGDLEVSRLRVSELVVEKRGVPRPFESRRPQLREPDHPPKGRRGGGLRSTAGRSTSPPPRTRER